MDDGWFVFDGFYGGRWRMVRLAFCGFRMLARGGDDGMAVDDRGGGEEVGGVVDEGPSVLPPMRRTWEWDSGEEGRRIRHQKELRSQG